jgi:hypothetical protein
MRDIDQDGTLDLPGNLLNDGQILTYIQSYDNSDDSISYYYSLDGSAAQFITKLTAADHSPNGNGFFSISTGNKWGQPNNQDAVWIQYKKWGTGTNEAGDLFTAKLGINSVSIVTSDDDRDGVINRNDALPNDPYESTDTDGDGVGDVGDLHNGYNDGLVAALDAAKLAADANTASTFDYYVADLGYSTGGGAITQEAYDAVLAEKATAVAAQATAEAAQATAVAALAAAPTASEIQSTFLNARVGSVGVSVSGGEATISLQVEESDDAMTTWSAPAEGATSVTIPVSGDATFFRVRAQ